MLNILTPVSVMDMSGLTDVLYLINNVDMYDARRGERLGENGCELSE